MFMEFWKPFRVAASARRVAAIRHIMRRRKKQKSFSSTAITFSNDESFFIVGYKEGSIRICVIESMEMVFEDKKHNDNIYKISISNDSQFFATSSEDKKLIIWNLLSRKVNHSIAFDNQILNVIFFKDCETLAITEWKSVFILKLKSVSNKRGLV